MAFSVIRAKAHSPVCVCVCVVVEIVAGECVEFAAYVRGDSVLYVYLESFVGMRVKIKHMKSVWWRKGDVGS